MTTTGDFTMPYIDTHVHLDEDQFDHDRDEVIARSRQAGIEALVCVGITAASSEATLRLARAHDDLYAAVGVQPNYCGEAAPGDWDRIVALAADPRAVAVGETGLDHHWDFTPPAVQEDYFDRHLRLAQQHDLPVVVHCRECEAEVTAMLREAAERGPLRGVLHAFGGTPQMAAECLEMGLAISFAGTVTYKNKKFKPLRGLAATIPDDRLLIETDSPYLVPEPLRGKQKRNEPALLVHTARALAELRCRSLEELSAQTTANTRRLFRLP